MRGIRLKALTIALGAALVAATTLVAGASARVGHGTSANARSVTLTFWQTMNEEETATLTRLVRRFERSHPGIRVRMVNVPFDQAQQRFATAAQAGRAPDVLRAEIAWIADYAARGFLADITKRVSARDRRDFLPTAFAYGVYRGKVWSVPQVTDAPALLYNKAMFQRARVRVPRTMAELGRACERMGPQRGIFLQANAYFVQPWLWAYGGGLINPLRREILVASRGSVAGFIEYIKLFRRTCAFPNRDFANDYTNMQTAFKNGRVAMIVNGPWATSDILQGPAFRNPNNLGIAPIPRGPAGQGSPVGGHNYVISRNSRKQTQAYTFIRWLSLPAQQAVFAARNNLLPTRKSAYNVPAVKRNRIIQAFLRQMLVARNRPVIPQGGRIYTDFTPNVQEGLLGHASPSIALRNVANAWLKFLPGYRIKS